MELDEMLKLDPDGDSRHQSQLQQMGQLKLEILRLNNRINVIKAFYNHFLAATTSIVRRELREKIDGESELISASITILTDAISRWELETQIKDLSENLKEVLAGYQLVLTDHKQLLLEKLRIALKVSHHVEDTSSKAFLVEQGESNSLNEAQHIEIEELYSHLLRCDFILRTLNTKYSAWLKCEEHGDVALLDISKLMEQAQSNQNISPNKLKHANRIKIALLAFFLSIGLIVFVYLLYQ